MAIRVGHSSHYAEKCASWTHFATWTKLLLAPIILYNNRFEDYYSIICRMKYLHFKIITVSPAENNTYALSLSHNHLQETISVLQDHYSINYKMRKFAGRLNKRKMVPATLLSPEMKKKYLYTILLCPLQDHENSSS